MKYLFDFVLVLTAIFALAAPAFSAQNDEIATGTVQTDEIIEIFISDGSNNNYHFSRKPENSEFKLEYQPISQEQSSSGIYNGGQPQSINLNAEKAEKLQQQILELGTKPELHLKNREMGSVQIIIVRFSGREKFILSQTDAAENLCADLKKLMNSHP
ncbi:MAG: hypothetical protein AB1403_03410 [Candidatus Riflebacteria bacterium]